MSAKVLMVQGTGSSVGKSLLVTAFCRIFARQGLHVAPFKAQNMSLNSHVTLEGHEIGRAQAVQAEACGIPASRLMNPVLLKPCGERRSQVIVNGRVRTTLDAHAYHSYRATLRDDVLHAFEELSARSDIIFIEGAGSPAEINLREHDLANMGVAELVNAPVVLAGDIDRGGVFASLYGTVKLLNPEEQQRIKGLIVNKFRGDMSILEPGLRRIEALLERPVLGTVPYLDVHIDEEDSLSEVLSSPDQAHGKDLDLLVIRLPRLANYTDFAALSVFDDVGLRYVNTPGAMGKPDAIILPGTKNTLEDMLFLRQSGLAEAILHAHAQGVPIVGICGGFQMLGTHIADPLHVESAIAHSPGLGLLDMDTTFVAVKQTTQSRLRVACDAGILRGTRGMLLSGYEIHMGQSRAQSHFALRTDNGINDAPEGAVNAHGTVFGTYLHGLFDNMDFTRALLNNLRRARHLPPLPPPILGWSEMRAREYDRLADLIEAHVDMHAIRHILDAS